MERDQSLCFSIKSRNKREVKTNYTVAELFSVINWQSPAIALVAVRTSIFPDTSPSWPNVYWHGARTRVPVHQNTPFKPSSHRVVMGA